jgi:hypothetical protein
MPGPYDDLDLYGQQPALLLGQPSGGALSQAMGQPSGFGGWLANPTTHALLGFASGLLKAGGPSPYPVSLGQGLGAGALSGLQGYSGAQHANAQNALAQAHLGLYNQQARKLQQEQELTNLVMQGGLGNFNDPDKLEMLGARLAASGHQGGATLIDRAEKLRLQQQNQAAVNSFRSAPGTLGAGVTTNTPQGQALLSNLTGDPQFDQGVLAAQNEALNSNPRLAPQPVAAPNPGLMGPLLNSPYVGPSAQSLQQQLDTTKGIPAQTWLTQFDRLQGLHSTGVNQAAARQETGALRRELAGQADVTRRELADQRDTTRRDLANMSVALRQGNQADLQNNRTFLQERTLSENYNALAKDFRKVLPQFQTAAQYVAAGKFDSSGDRALVFNFAKALDPQDRVGVNDIKDINKLGNVPERIVQAVNSLAEGKMLPDRIRQEMFAVMRHRFDAMNEQQQSIEDEYTTRAQRYMLNPSNVVLPYAVRRNAAAPAPGAGQVVDFNQLPRGR